MLLVHRVVVLLEIEETNNPILSTCWIAAVRRSSETKHKTLVNECSKFDRIYEHQRVNLINYDQITVLGFEFTTNMILYLLLSVAK